MTSPYQRRLAQFRASFQEQGLRGAVISRAQHIFYLSGWVAGGSPAFLLVGTERWIAVLPRSLTQAWSLSGEGDVRTYADDWLDDRTPLDERVAQALQSAVIELGLVDQAVGVELAHLRGIDLRVLERLCPVHDLGMTMPRLRRGKDEEEVARIQANVAVLEAAFDAVQRVVRPGITELEVWAAIYAAAVRQAGCPLVLTGNLASGPRTLEPDPQPTDRSLAAGDLVLVDLYPVIQGYCADLTRTFVVGAPTAEQLAQHRVLEAALDAAVAALRPGVRACDVDAAVREQIEAKGYGPYFPHHSGHGLGLDAQEAPFLVPADETVLQEGDVIAIEPGIYHPGTGGMRLEGNYLVTSEGAVPLTRYPFQLIACG
jgi:Xaa-Pro aminopeptidase